MINLQLAFRKQKEGQSDCAADKQIALNMTNMDLFLKQRTRSKP